MFYFHLYVGKMNPFWRSYVSDGLVQPTRNVVPWGQNRRRLCQEGKWVVGLHINPNYERLGNVQPPENQRISPYKRGWCQKVWILFQPQVFRGHVKFWGMYFFSNITLWMSMGSMWWIFAPKRFRFNKKWHCLTSSSKDIVGSSGILLGMPHCFRNGILIWGLGEMWFIHPVFIFNFQDCNDWMVQSCFNHLGPVFL